VRPLVQLLMIDCVLLTFAPLGAQTSPIRAPLVLTISMPVGEGRVHVGLKNRSTAPLHVRLGIHNGRDWPQAISLLFVNAGGKKIPIVPALPGYVEGNVGNFDEVIGPGREWTTDIELTDFMVYKDPVYPGGVSSLPAGAYTVYGIFEADGRDWMGRKDHPRVPGLPYWVGTIRSAPVRYVISK
jgi:hypothetical protein